MAAGANIFGCAGPILLADEAAFFRESDPWGFIVFDRNLESPNQIRALCGDMRAAVGRDAPILIDQEGGRVQRLRPPLAREWRPPSEDAKAAGPRAMCLRYRLIAAELRDLGIDVNCVPTADIARPETHPFLRNRCYGSSAADVTRNARAVSKGLLAGGVLPVIKHIPGHGRGTIDSHLQTPVVDAPREVLMAEDFAPFAALSDLPLGMTAHLVFRAIDPERPATISPAMINLIRDDIGFDGLLMTDDLSMEALGGSVGDRASNAVAAGCDVALHCNGHFDEMQDVAAAAGRMTARAALAADRALAQRKAPEPIDIAAVQAEFEALLQGEAHDRDR